MSFQPIKRIIPKTIQDAGIQREVMAARVLGETAETLIRLWGEEKAAFVRTVSFQEGTLKLEATAPAALQELRVWEIRVLNEVNRRLGSKQVLRLVYVSRF